MNNRRPWYFLYTLRVMACLTGGVQVGIVSGFVLNLEVDRTRSILDHVRYYLVLLILFLLWISEQETCIAQRHNLSLALSLPDFW